MDAVLALTTRTAVAIEACQTVCDAAKAARHLIQYVVPRYASDLSVAANVLAFCANRATRRADVRCSLAILLCGYPVRWFLAWNSVSLIVFTARLFPFGKLRHVWRLPVVCGDRCDRRGDGGRRYRLDHLDVVAGWCLSVTFARYDLRTARLELAALRERVAAFSHARLGGRGVNLRARQVLLDLVDDRARDASAAGRHIRGIRPFAQRSWSPRRAA
jgi:hypothetical protein